MECFLLVCVCVRAHAECGGAWGACCHAEQSPGCPLNPCMRQYPDHPPAAAPAQGGHVATVRESRGDDEMAACGQLGSPGEASSERRPAPPILPPPESLRPALAGASS